MHSISDTIFKRNLNLPMPPPEQQPGPALEAIDATYADAITETGIGTPRIELPTIVPAETPPQATPVAVEIEEGEDSEADSPAQEPARIVMPADSTKKPEGD